MQQATETIGFAPDALWIFLGVLVAIAIIAKVVTDLMVNARKLRAPAEEDEKSVKDKLRSDHERLTRLENSTVKQDEELQLLLRSNLVMIHHMVDGNGTAGLKDMQKQIEDYLVYGKIREV